MEISIFIDQITQCLKSNKTQQYVKTIFRPLHCLPANKNWLFDWKDEYAARKLIDTYFPKG